MNLRVFWTIAAMCFVSCRAPVSWNGEAALSVTIGGVVPRTVPSASFAGSRLILSQTASVRLSVTTANFQKESITEYSGPGTKASLGGLPVGIPLGIQVETLDAQGVVLTSWTETVNLAAGSNPVSARLLPVDSLVEEASAMLNDLAKIDLVAGSAIFVTVVIPAADAPNTINEYQLIANTGNYKTLWLDAYDSDWNDLPAVAADADQGWKVINVPKGGGKVRVAVAAPDGARTATLQARPAMFFATASQGGSASNAGTSASPRLAFQDNLDIDGRSLFVKAGSYTGSATWRTEAHVYGGFSADDWSLRNTDSYATVFTSLIDSNTAIAVSGIASGYLDGMTVKPRNYQGTGATGDRGLNLSTTGNFVVRGCRLLGPDIGGPYVTLVSKALSIEGGTPEIVDCYIDGGKGITGTIGATAVTVSAGRPFIYLCRISGGYCVSDSASTNTAGVNIESGGSAIISRCSIYGGTSVTNASIRTVANSYGIKILASPSAQVIIANSILSGGYSKGSVNYPGNLYGVYSENTTASNYPIIINNVIDAGISIQSTKDDTFAAMYSAPEAGYILASGNVFLVSSQLSTSIMIRIGTTKFKGFTGNSAFGSFGGSFVYRVGNTNGIPWQSVTLPNYSDNATFTSSTYIGNTTELSIPTSDVFTVYYKDNLNGSATDFSYWLSDNDWRPKAAYASYFTGAYNPVSSGDIPAADVAAYPELLLDRGGNPRPATGAWTRGAYQ